MFDNPRIEETPQCSPGCCYACGAGSLARKWFINTDLDSHDTPGYTIYFCDSCFDILAVTASYAKIIGPDAPVETEENELERIRSALDWIGLDLGGLLDQFDRVTLAAQQNHPSVSGDSESNGGGATGTPGTLESGTDGSDESSSDEDLGPVRRGKPKLRVLTDDSPKL